jgi:hypothetical protein
LLVLDPARSRVRVQTFAEGMFARLAHDLELECEGLTGSAAPQGSGGYTAVVSAPVDRIVVRGVIKGQRVDPAGIKDSDRDDIVQKMRKEVFHATSSGAVVRVEVDLADGSPAPERRLQVRIVPPHGRAIEQTITAAIPSLDRAAGSLRLRLSALGSDPVKGPMNAFRVKDEVVVHFDLVFVRAPDLPQPA